MGRLSNPPDTVETLTGQGVVAAGEVLGKTSGSAEGPDEASHLRREEEKGQLSNPDGKPIQRRLTDVDVDELVTGYRAGRSLPDLADDFGVHRRTVATHLEQRGVRRRLNLRKMSEGDIADAGRRYRAGDSLATVGRTHGVDPATVRRELVRAGVEIRPRRGDT
jgi:hypothetical protein